MREEHVRQVRLRKLSAEQTAAIQDWPLGTAARRVGTPSTLRQLLHSRARDLGALIRGPSGHSVAIGLG